MIADLDDLVAYTHRLADKLPELRGSIAITKLGYSSETVAALRQMLPGLPDSYVSMVESVKIDSISIGYFQLTPSSSLATGLIEKLRDYNDPTITPMADRYRVHQVYQVASWEADPIGVVYADGAFKVGQIVMYNVGNPEAAPTILADGFEQFLLLAGNLDEIRDKYAESDDPSEALREFSAYLEPITFGREDNMDPTWRQIAEVVLT